MAILLSFNNFSLYLLSYGKKSPKHHWSSYSITLHSGPNPGLERHCISLLCHKKQHNEKHSFLCIILPDDTIGKFFLLDVFVHICLPQSLTDVKKFAASLSHIATHVIDVCPHKRERKQDILTSCL